MIRLITDNNTFKITSAEYENDGYSKTIEIKVLTISNNNNDNNIGTILEKYRKIDSDSEKYFISKKDILKEFIFKETKPIDDFKPDGIICIFPHDNNRKQLLSNFKKILCSSISNESAIDYSSNFLKKDNLSLSIKRDNLTAIDFELSLDKLESFRNLLIIDDVIDEGKTLEILLEKLLIKKLIDKTTEIKMHCIYNRPKKNRPIINPLQAYTKSLNEDNELPHQ